MKERWLDAAAGPVVRPYAMTGGRTRGADDARLDLIALVTVEPGVLTDGVDHAAGADPPSDPGPTGSTDASRTGRSLGPEHLDIVALCRETPLPIAELAAELDLPVGVVRVFIDDLIDADLVRVTRPVPPAELPDEGILRDVINGLRAL